MASCAKFENISPQLAGRQLTKIYYRINCKQPSPTLFTLQNNPTSCDMPLEFATSFHRYLTCNFALQVGDQLLIDKRSDCFL